MAHSSRSRFPRVSAKRRRVSWSLGPRGAITTQTAAGDAIFSTSAQAVADDLTIVCVRGEVVLNVTGSTVLDGWSQIVMGLCVVSENAAAVGITGVPHPVEDIAWDGWLWYWTGCLFELDAAATIATEYRIVIDNKAMRKTHATDVVVAVLESATELGTATLDATMNTRMLVKLL